MSSLSDLHKLKSHGYNQDTGVGKDFLSRIPQTLTIKERNKLDYI